jgi:cytochrome c5
MPMTLRLLALTLTGALLSACDNSAEAPQKAPEMPRFEQAALNNGRTLWMGTCRNCHLLGIAGAPAVTNFQAWEPRIAKGKPALYQSALNGVNDAQGAVRMPARGGNTRLSDEQVKRAVNYMLASVEYLHKNATKH